MVEGYEAQRMSSHIFMNNEEVNGVFGVPSPSVPWPQNQDDAPLADFILRLCGRLSFLQTSESEGLSNR